MLQKQIYNFNSYMALQLSNTTTSVWVVINAVPVTVKYKVL